MDEQQIVDGLKENIPVAYESPVAKLTNPVSELSYASDFPLDELVQYKLHDYFGEQYRPNNEENKQRLSFIYDEVSKMVDERDYGFVIAKIRDLERIIGITTTDNRMYRLYQWLKLDKTRRSVEAEMGAITND